MLQLLPVLLGTLLLVAAGPAPALTIDFEEFDHLEVVASPIGTHDGYTLIVDRFKSEHDVAIVHDTTIEESDLGKILSFAERIPLPCESESKDCFDREHDWKGGRHDSGGKFTFLLDELVNSFAFDLIGLSGKESKHSSITFFLLEEGSASTEVASYRLKDFFDKKDKDPVHHIDFGEIGSFNAFEIVLGGSDGIDNIFANGTPVPEPATAAMIGLGLSALAVAARRRRG